jgi:hypothetical protein
MSTAMISLGWWRIAIKRSSKPLEHPISRTFLLCSQALGICLILSSFHFSINSFLNYLSLFPNPEHSLISFKILALTSSTLNCSKNSLFFSISSSCDFSYSFITFCSISLIYILLNLTLTYLLFSHLNHFGLLIELSLLDSFLNYLLASTPLSLSGLCAFHIWKLDSFLFLFYKLCSFGGRCAFH